ncbi:MAG: type II secretion system pilot lipoprotein GspS-beta [Plesiomonas shigelloides]
MKGYTIYPLIVIVGVLMSGCSSSVKNDEAEQLAIRQTQNISQNLPVKSGRYTLVLAQRAEAEIKLTFVYDELAPASLSTTSLAPAAFIDVYKKHMCTDPTICTFLAKGMSYQLVINNLQGVNLQTVLLNKTSCS